MASKPASLVKHTAIYWVGNALNRVGAYLLLPLYTHYLSLSEYGALEMLYSVNSVLAVVLGAGLSHTTLRFYYEYDAERDRNSVIVTNMLVTSLLGLCGSALIVYFSKGVSTLIFRSEAYADAVAILAIITVFELISEVMFAYLRARELSIPYVLISAGKLMIQLPATYYFLVHQEEGIIGVLKSNFLSVLFSWSVLMFIVIRNCGITINLGIVQPIMRYSIPFAASSIIWSVASNADKYILNLMTDLANVGLYGLAMKLATILRFLVIEPFGRSFGAYRFSTMKNEDTADVQGNISHYFFIVMSVIGFGIAIFSPEVLMFVSTSDYWDASNYVPVILIGMLAQGMTYCYQTGILFRKKTKYVLHISIGAMILTIGLTYVMVHYMGLLGAALSFSTVSVVVALVTERVSQRLFTINYRHREMFAVFGVILLFYVVQRSFGLDNVLIKILWKLAISLIMIFAVMRVDGYARTMYENIIKFARQRILVIRRRSVR